MKTITMPITDYDSDLEVSKNSGYTLAILTVCDKIEQELCKEKYIQELMAKYKGSDSSYEEFRTNRILEIVKQLRDAKK